MISEIGSIVEAVPAKAPPRRPDALLLHAKVPPGTPRPCRNASVAEPILTRLEVTCEIGSTAAVVPRAGIDHPCRIVCEVVTPLIARPARFSRGTPTQFASGSNKCKTAGRPAIAQRQNDPRQNDPRRNVRVLNVRKSVMPTAEVLIARTTRRAAYGIA